MTAIDAPSRRHLPARRLGTPPPARAGGSPPRPGALPLPRPLVLRSQARPRELRPNATVVARAELGPTMATFTLAPDGGTAAHAPGQYFALGLAIDGQPVLRPYSAASEAGSATLQFVIRLVPDGALTPALWRLGIGDRLWIGPPKGLFRLVDDDPRTHLLIGTGTGIAPLVAMARALRRRTAPPATVVVHGASRVDELAFRGDLEHWASAAPWLQYAPSVSRPDEPVNDGWRGRTGRLDAAIPALLADLDVEPRTAVAYVCGNPAMIEALRGLLPRLGVPASSIRSESF